MKRTDADEHLSNMFQDENLPTTAGTLVDASWLNAVQEEIANVIEADGTALDSGDDTQLLEAIRKISAVRAFTGDRSDGNHTVAGTELITEDPSYDLLTVPPGTTLNTGGHIIRARKIVIEATGVIHRNGASGTNNSGGTGGPGLTLASNYHHLGGGTGGNGGDDDNNGTAGAAFFGFGGTGGAGANSGANTGGAGGAITNNSGDGSTPFAEPRNLPAVLGHLTGSDDTPQRWGGGTGGGGGAGEGTGAVGMGGGGGGSGAGVVILICDELENNGSITAIGGAGGNSSGGINGGGGGGGGGGVVVIAAGSLSGSGSTSVVGGAGGTGGAAGSAGSAGQVWYLFAQP